MSSKCRDHVIARKFGIVLSAGLAGCMPVGEPETLEEPPPRPTIAADGGSRAGAGGSPGFGAIGGSGLGGGSSGLLVGPAVSSSKPPPALSGGTLIVLRDGRTAVAADPDRDAIHVADLASEKALGSVALMPFDEPGRLVEDAAGRVHVALRRGGAVVAIDPVRLEVVARRAVCGAPRGLAYDEAGDALVVACAGGELVTMPAAGGAATSTFRLERDLRDVVVSGDRLMVSVFRSAELLVVDRTGGTIAARKKAPGSRAAQRLVPPTNMRAPTPPSTTSSETPSKDLVPAASPGVAWRLRETESGVAMIHQEASNGELGTEAGGYGGGPCKSLMGAAVSTFPNAGVPTTSGQLMFAALPIDFALSPKGPRMAVLAAGNTSSTPARGLGQKVYAMRTDLTDPGECVQPTLPPDDPVILELRQPIGEPTAIAFDGMGRVVVQSREPARLEIVSHRGGTIKLSDESRADTGHTVFHMATVAGVACASCHPEGGDDGRSWTFAKIGKRRTQNLLGGIMQTAPFHWDGDMTDLTKLMSTVFSGRMSGPKLVDDQVKALGGWMDALPALAHPTPTNIEAVARGKALFDSPKAACGTCHTGALLTNNKTVAVGKATPTQVPSLKGVAWRAPFMHDGCAATMKDRFDPACGGGDLHGVTSHLKPADIADLVAYLESL